MRPRVALIALDPAVLADIVLHSGFEVGDSLCVRLRLLSLGFCFVRGLDRLGAGRLGCALRLVCAVLRGQRVGSGLDCLSLSSLSRAFRLDGLSRGFPRLDDLGCDLRGLGLQASEFASVDDLHDAWLSIHRRGLGEVDRGVFRQGHVERRDIQVSPSRDLDLPHPLRGVDQRPICGEKHHARRAVLASEHAVSAQLHFHGTR